MRKSPIHSGTSRFISVTLDAPCKRTNRVHSYTSITSYSSRQSRVARRSKRKLDRSRAIQKAHQIYARYYASTDYLHLLKLIGSDCTAFGIDCTAYLCIVSFRYVRVQDTSTRLVRVQFIVQSSLEIATCLVYLSLVAVSYTHLTLPTILLV